MTRKNLHPASSGTTGDRRCAKQRKRWTLSRNARALLAHVVIRLVFSLIRIMFDD